MFNLKQLESQWLQYKIKSFLPHLIILISLSVIIIIVTTVDFMEEEDEIRPIKVKEEAAAPIDAYISAHTTNALPAVVQKPVVVPDSIEIPVNTPEKKISVQKIEEDLQTLKEKKKLLIKPSLDFIRNIKDDSPSYYNSDPEFKMSSEKEEEITQKIQTAKIEEIVLDTDIQEVQKDEITIKRQNTQDDIQHVVKRFKESNNPTLSLFVAKKYYELKNYNQSYNYALLTNQINNDIEESWIIFAKSLYKLDQKEKAIEILQKYITSSHSHRAEMLLDNIRSGKIQ